MAFATLKGPIQAVAQFGDIIYHNGFNGFAFFKGAMQTVAQFDNDFNDFCRFKSTHAHSCTQFGNSFRGFC